MASNELLVNDLIKQESELILFIEQKKKASNNSIISFFGQKKADTSLLENQLKVVQKQRMGLESEI